MTETINTEAVQGDESVAETPNQQGSQPEAVTSPVDEAMLKALVEPIIQAEVERRVDSYKDKRIAKLSTETKTLKESLAEVKALQAEGMSEKQAVQYMETQEFLASQGQEVPTDAPPPEEPAVQPQVAADTYLSSVLKMGGLKDTDPDVIAILRDESDPAKQLIALGTPSEARKQTSPPIPAQALPSGSGQAVVSEDIDSLSKRLNELVDLPMQTPESEAERAEIREKINKIDPIKK